MHRSRTLQVFLLVLTILYAKRGVLMEIRLNRSDRERDEASSASRIILHHGTDPTHGRPFTAKRESSDPVQLYAHIISDIETGGEGRGGMICTGPLGRD